VARIYDYHLGGSHNFAADRGAAEQIAALMPDLPLIMRANRAFLRRAVRYLAGVGIRQYLDLGSGIPTAGNVHEIVQRAVSDARVVYVDVDPVAVAHSRALLAGNPLAAAVRADLRNVATVLGLPEVSDLIDFTEPVAVLMVAVLHFVPDRDDPAGIVSGYVRECAPGSYLVASHAAAAEEDSAPRGADAAAAAYSRTVAEATLRTREQVAGLLAGLELVEPGVVYVDEWRPDLEDAADRPGRRLAQLVGMGRKPVVGA
jgi:trans-aconitate methyltransferase